MRVLASGPRARLADLKAREYSGSARCEPACVRLLHCVRNDAFASPLVSKVSEFSSSRDDRGNLAILAEQTTRLLRRSTLKALLKAIAQQHIRLGKFISTYIKRWHARLLIKIINDLGDGQA